MIQRQRKKGIKEFFRKLAVSLKTRPHNIPLLFLVVTFIVYSFNLTTVSNTTARINVFPMGLCSFLVMLCSILSFVAFLNAFPKRQKPRLFMVIVLAVLLLLVASADIGYLLCIEKGFTNHPAFLEESTLTNCRNLMYVHLGFLGFTAILIACIPLLGKAFGLINTSVDLGENKEMGVIEVEDE